MPKVNCLLFGASLGFFLNRSVSFAQTPETLVQQREAYNAVSSLI